MSVRAEVVHQSWPKLSLLGYGSLPDAVSPRRPLVDNLSLAQQPLCHHVGQRRGTLSGVRAWRDQGLAEPSYWRQRSAAEKLGCLHRLSSCGLQFQDANSAVLTSNRKLVVDHRAG